MIELEFTIQQQYPDTASNLRPFLDKFEAEHHVRVHLTAYSWEEAWKNLVKVGLYRHGPDVSQVGSTWLTDLASMNALRPFGVQEQRIIGGLQQFFEPFIQIERSWEGAELWGVPFLGYTRLIYYRKDWFGRAGIDPSTAFSSPAALAAALQRLQESGVANPWIAPIPARTDSVHDIASWIWWAGGNFLTPDGQHPAFNQPAAMEGLKAYFELYRYMPSSAGQPGVGLPSYESGQVAVAIGGPMTWLYDMRYGQSASAEAVANTGVSVPFGKPFLSASHLVLWKHSRYPDLALKLIRYLTGHTVQSDFVPRIGLPPVRQDSLDDSPFRNELIYPAVKEALQSGRSFRPVPLWGLIEEKLISAIQMTWSEVLSQPNPDIPAILNKHFDYLARRLELTMSQ
jgi:multiple sugar transport system substrate-binding protein